MKKQIFVDGVHEHDLEVEDKTYTLYYSNGEQWNSHTRGTIACQIVDDGNGFTVSKLQEKDRIDYSEISYLYILLREIERDSVYQIANLKDF